MYFFVFVCSGTRVTFIYQNFVHIYALFKYIRTSLSGLCIFFHITQFSPVHKLLEIA